MSTEPGPALSTDPLSFGQRMQLLRTRRGMSRPLLAGLVGRSPSWVKQVEAGKLHTPRLPMILRIAEALRVRDLSELVGEHPTHTALFIGPGHQRLGAVADALNTFPVEGGEPPSKAHLRARLARSWSARHSSSHHREVIGRMLPGLIHDAQLLVRHTETGADRRSAQALLAETYQLAQFFLAYQPDSALVWRVSERGMVAAQESEDPHAIGVAAWLMAQAHRDTGPSHYEAADRLTRDAVRFLEPRLSDASNDVRAIAGALSFETGYTAARRGDTGSAWRHWDLARQVADRLPADYFHPITSFSQAIMGAHAVTIAVELHAGGEAVRQATRASGEAIPSKPRRARHRIEEARGYQLDGQPEAALATLERAHEAAPETIRWNGFARRIVLEEAEAKSPSRRERAATLAVKIGLLTP
ncbi:helix-turn-helix domain-containing protein [Streptomyces sp. NBRC 109706]|uniref:helix-turn-helix domain-containing protein n=1 Tax=Streptomyces sp. NBRC 109706 TaxID=1550035 RepID=UPI0007822DE9|nr:helix-turn-helix transcriptional regulator [Streptomyces sp. NBRC 109706]